MIDGITPGAEITSLERAYGIGELAEMYGVTPRGKRLGISLAEIGDWLDLYDMEDGERRRYEALLEGSRTRIADLERQHTDLEETLRELRAIESLALERDGEPRTGSRAGKRAQRAERNR